MKKNKKGRPAGEKEQRVIYLDVWRTLCVVCVVITHADEVYQDWDTVAVTKWVLQIIMCTSGLCYSFSRATGKHILRYVSRLLLLFSVGCCFNWVGSAIGGHEWWTDVSRSIWFQNSFVLLMVAGSILAFPLKVALDSDSKFKCFSAVIGFYLFVTVVCASLWIQFDHFDAPMLPDIPFRDATATGALLTLAATSVLKLPAKWHGVSGWVLLAYIYAVQVGFANDKFGYWIHLVNIYIWAFFVQRTPLHGTEKVGAFIAEGWILIYLPVCLVGLTPGSIGRDDHSKEMHLRARHYCLEALIVVSYTTIPTAGRQRTLPMPAILRRHVPWMKWWSLFIFSCHMGVYYAIPLDRSPGPTIQQCGGKKPLLVLSTSFVFAALHWRLLKHQTRPHATDVKEFSKTDDLEAAETQQKEETADWRTVANTLQPPGRVEDSAFVGA